MARLGLRFDLLSRGAGDAERDLDRLGDASQRTGSRVSGLGKALGGAFAVTTLVAGAKAAVDSFAAIEDATGAAGVQFGAALPQVQKFAEGATDSFGLSERAALDAANSFGTLGKSAGLQGPALANFATKFTGLAADLASFKGTSTEQAIEAVGAALRGEAEPIRAYGVLLDDATLRQEALAQGLIKTTKEALNPQQKVLATQALLLKSTGDAQGDFSRTSDSTANTQKRLQAATENSSAALGEKLAPAFTAARAALIRFVDGTTGAIDGLSSATTSVRNFARDNSAALAAVAAAVTARYIPAMVRATAATTALNAARLKGLVLALGDAIAGAGGLAASLRRVALTAAPLLAVGALTFAIVKGRQEAAAFDAKLRELGETKVADPGFAATREALVATIAKLEEFGKAPDQLRLAREELARLDGAVQSSNTNVGALARTFGVTNEELLRLANAAKVDLGSASFEDAKVKIEGYRTAAAAAGTSSQKLADAQKVLGDEVATTEDKVKALNDAFDAFYGVALSAQEANDRYKASLRDALVALKENGRSLSNNTEAGRANREVIRGIITDSKKKADSDFAATGSQDRYNRILAQGREDALRLARATGAGAAEVKNFAREVRLVPPQKTTKIGVNFNPANAFSRVKQIADTVRGLQDKKFTVTQIIRSEIQRDQATANRLSTNRPRLTAAPGRAKSRAGGAAGNPEFEDAGRVAGASFRIGLVRDLTPAVETVRQVSKSARQAAIDELEKTISTAERKLDAAKGRLSTARDALLNIINLRRDLIVSVRDSLRGSVNSLFDATGIDDIVGRLQEQKQKLQDFVFDITNLRGRGVSNDLLNQLLQAGPDQAAGFAAALSTAGDGQLRQVLALRNEISSISAGAAVTAGNAQFAQQIALAQRQAAAAERTVQEQTATNARLDKVLAALEAAPTRTAAALTGTVRR